jgi:biopolymer transport protein ExbB/TolQ
MRFSTVLFGILFPAGAAFAADPTVMPSDLDRVLQFTASAFEGLGGPFMWSIVIVSVIATTLAVERSLFLYRAGRGNTALFDHVARLVGDKRIEEARAVSDRSQTPFGRIVHSVLGIRHGHRPEELQNLLDEAYLREVPALHRRTPLLSVFANIATLLGLLGTIVGLIMAFDALANVPAAQRTAALAQGISVAMATTGLGLIVAIPSLAVHGLLTSRAERLVEEAESRLAVLTNLLTEWNRTQQADPYEESKTGVRAREERLVDYVVAGEVK